MSIIESSRLNGRVLYHDSINFSTSKQKYSFGISKAKRFPQLRKNLNDKVGYELPPTNNGRGTGFGIGHRFSTPMSRAQNCKLHNFIPISS